MSKQKLHSDGSHADLAHRHILFGSYSAVQSYENISELVRGQQSVSAELQLLLLNGTWALQCAPVLTTDWSLATGRFSSVLLLSPIMLPA